MEYPSLRISRLELTEVVTMPGVAPTRIVHLSCQYLDMTVALATFCDSEEVKNMREG